VSYRPLRQRRPRQRRPGPRRVRPHQRREYSGGDLQGVIDRLDDPRNPDQRAAAIYRFTPAIADYNDPDQEANLAISGLDDQHREPDGARRPQGLPTVKVDPPTRTITFTCDRNHFGVASSSGVKLYITTWDFDGIGAILRPLTESGGQWRMGGGGPPYAPDPVDPAVKYSSDPKIMDDLPVITIP
jgi:hypothetical protein